MIELDTAIQLLEEKEALYEKIYDFTSKNSFLGVEEEVERYAEFIEAREPMVNRIRRIDEALAGFMAEEKSKFEQSGYCKEAETIQERISVIQKKIMELDMPTNQKMNRLLEELRCKVGEITANKRMMSAYQTNLGQSDGYFIDRKN